MSKFVIEQASNPYPFKIILKLAKPIKWQVVYDFSADKHYLIMELPDEE